jgi:hypothetical protein
VVEGLFWLVLALVGALIAGLWAKMGIMRDDFERRIRHLEELERTRNQKLYDR